ncbi:antirestriction protein ArdA [Fodinicola acaciae]|uniref:antirestriction protein ArdA n=1 Tax=Fodinicola acaciae TaxID=2681555 RepID=UPI0013D0C59E|nr:antirestriction protein ArdA [Fodinicola acaciae]
MSADSPQIYVADLAAYVAGRLRGVWIDATQDPEDIHLEIKSMLADEDTGGNVRREEYAIHDYEGFGPVTLGEYEDIATVAGIARGIAEHGPAFAAWVTTRDRINLEDDLDSFQDAYLGTFDSVKDYAETLADDMGWYAAMADAGISESYLDVAAFARDLELGGDITTVECDGSLHIFDPRL